PSTLKIACVVWTIWCIASSTRISPNRSLPSSFSAWRTSCIETLISSAPGSFSRCTTRGSRFYLAVSVEAGQFEDAAHAGPRTADNRPAAAGQPLPGAGDQPRRPAIHEVRPAQVEDEPAGAVPESQRQPGREIRHRHQVKLSLDDDRGNSRAGFHLDRDPAILCR